MKRGGPLILLDRDGTLIEEKEYLTDPAQVKLLPGVPAGLRRLKNSGLSALVISNQSGVGRGIVTRAQARSVWRRFERLLRERGASVDGIYWCAHRPADRCACRKPRLALVKRAARDLGKPWRGAISVGDRPSDVRLGQRAKGAGVLVLSGYGRRWSSDSARFHPDFKAKNFKRAVDWILRRVKKER